MADPFLSIRQHLDRAGVVMSGLCAVHCLLGLAVVSVLGLGGDHLLAPAIHEIGLALALLVGFVSLGLGAWRHRRTGPLAIGATGLVLMAAALAVRHGHGEALLTIAGVILVAAAHIGNLRHAR